MGVDESRHNPLSRGVDNFHVVCIFESYIAGQAPRAFDTIALNHNGLIADRRMAATVY